jgi:hypothetical protein
MLQRLLLIALTLCSLTASAQWQQTGSKVRYVNGLGIPTKDTSAGVAADSSQILIRPADSSLYIKYKRTWLRVGGGAGGGSVGGTGAINTVAKFTATGFIGNSQIYDNGTYVGIGSAVTSGNSKFVYSFSQTTNNTISGMSIISLLSPTTSTNYSTWYYRSVGGGLFGLTNPYTGFVNYTDAAATSYINDGSGYFSWHNSTAELMRLTNGGNVGIGYTAPAAKLSVSGTTLINTNTDNGVDKLQVSGSAIVSTNLTVGNPYASPQETLNVKDRAYFADSKYQYLKVGMSSDRAIINTDWFSGAGGTVPALAFQTGSIDRLVITSTGESTFSAGFQAATTSGNVSLRTTASTYAVNMNTGANSGIGFYEDGTQSTIIGQNQNITATNFLSLRGAGLDLVALGSTNATIKTNSNNRLQVLSSGRVLIGTTLPTDNTVDAVQINGTVLSTQYKLSALNTAPATASSTGTLGEIRIDANYIYICTATNTWKRVAIATW